MSIAKQKRKQAFLDKGELPIPYLANTTNNNPNVKDRAHPKGNFSPAPYKNNGIVSKNSSLYYEDRNMQIFKLAILGLKLAEISEVFGIKLPVLKSWMKKYPALKESFQAGKIQASSEVAISLYKLATGYSHPEQKIFMNRIKEYDPDTGKVIREYNEPLIVDTIKHYSPNFNAINKFLTIKEPEKWKEDAIDSKVEHSFALQKGSEDLKDVTVEELALMESIGLRDNVKKKKKKKKKKV